LQKEKQDVLQKHQLREQNIEAALAELIAAVERANARILGGQD